MKYISDLQVGDRVRFGTIDGKDILWAVGAKNHSGYPADSVSMITYHALRAMPMDGKEPNSPSNDRKLFGNSYYTQSNLHQWLNKATQPWFVAAHATDSAPNSNNVDGAAYEHEYGFLNCIPEALRKKLLDTPLVVAKPPLDGGGAENITAKVFLPSLAEVTGESTGGTNEGIQWALFQNQNSRVATAPGGAAQPWRLRSCETREHTLPGDSATMEGPNNTVRVLHQHRWTDGASNGTGTSSCCGYITTDGMQGAMYTAFPRVSGGVNTWLYNYSYHSFASSAAQYIRPALNLPTDVRVTDEPGSDGAYEIVYNTPPVISGSDQDLGSKTAPFDYKYTVSDEDTTKAITVTETLTGGGVTRTLRSYTVQNGAENTAAIGDNWLYVQSGANTLAITADDGNGGVATRTVTFTRTIASIAASRAFSTDAIVTRCMLSLFPATQGTASELVVQATNNPFDASPVWEDVTAKVNKYVHVFENQAATGGPGLAYRFRITPSTGGQVVFDSMHVRFE